MTGAQFRVFVERTGIALGESRALDGPANHPVGWVNWHEAVRYCEWLTGEFRESAQTPAWLRSLLGADDGCRWAVRLPSEAEWERAARGRDGRWYPWGDEAPTPERANYADTWVRTTSAVGCFPAGATPGEGVEELAGNVWEWTRSKHWPYPYRAGDGREDATGDDARAARGGAFNDHARWVRAFFRGGNAPDSRYVFRGFRVVVSPFRS